MISTVALFWALCVVCVVNMARYYSSLRALLVVLRGCDPLLYQYVDGGGFFTSHGQPSKQIRLVGYILLNAILIIMIPNLSAAVRDYAGNLY